MLIAGAGYDPPAHFQGISLQRYLTDGGVDPSFADSSNVVVMDGSDTRVNAIAVDDSGAIFAACSLTNFDDPDGGPGYHRPGSPRAAGRGRGLRRAGYHEDNVGAR